MNKDEWKNSTIIFRIKRNWRYKGFKYNGKNYLIDSNPYCFSFLLFMVNWFVSMNAYEIDDTIVRQLGIEYSKNNNINFSISLLIVSLSAMLAKVVDIIFKKKYISDKFNYIFIIGLPVISLCYFSVSRLIEKRKIMKIVGDKKKRIMVRFQLSSKNAKKMWKTILILLIFFLGSGFYLGRNILLGDPGAKDYIGYILAVSLWFYMIMYTGLTDEYLVDATVIIEDKERK